MMLTYFKIQRLTGMSRGIAGSYCKYFGQSPEDSLRSRVSGNFLTTSEYPARFLGKKLVGMLLRGRYIKAVISVDVF